MGILTRPKIADPVRVVLCADPDVMPNDEACAGWIEADRATLSEGATVVEVRALNVDQRATAVDASLPGDDGGRRDQRAQLRRCRLAGVPDDVLAQLGDNPIYLLGAFVADLTECRDPQPHQRRLCGKEAGPDEGAEKSGS